MPAANSNDDSSMVGGHDLADASEREIRELDNALNEGNADKPGADTGGGDNRSADNHDDDDDLGDGERTTKVDTELEEARTPEEREEIRARRRVERKNRKNNQRERFDALHRQQENLLAQNRDMAAQLARLQNNDNSAKLNQLDASIQEAADVQKQAMNAHADAVAKADGPRAAQAMELMLRARDRHTQLSAVKESAVQQTRTPSPINPVVRRNATEFSARNTWYKGPGAPDADSQVMTLLDNAVAKEGFDPTTPAYWEELEARAKRYIPHRYANGSTQDPTAAGGNSPRANESGYNADTTTRGPRSPVGGAGQRGNSGSADSEGGFKLSAERVKAMKEAGIWDDTERRQKMITKYRELDKQNS